MKQIMRSTLAVLAAVMVVLSLAACNTVEKTGIWEDAVYLKDMELGEGEKVLSVEVKAEDKSVLFTIHTDKKTVGEALLEHKLIDGDEGDFGLYVKQVNGITADFDEDQTYWAFYIDGELAMTGVDMTDIDESAAYRLERAK